MSESTPRHKAIAAEIALFRKVHPGVGTAEAAAAIVAIKENNPFYVHPRFEKKLMGGIPLDVRITNPDGSLPEFDPIPGLVALLYNGTFFTREALAKFDRYKGTITDTAAILTEDEVWVGSSGGPVAGAVATVENESQVVSHGRHQQVHGAVYLTIKSDVFSLTYLISSPDSLSARLFAEAVNKISGRGSTPTPQPSSPTPAAATPPEKASVEERMNQLHNLLEKNLVTEDEFQAKRLEILADL